MNNQADLIELAATWCDSTAASESNTAVAQLWRSRAKMLRDGYQPMLVRASPSEADQRDAVRYGFLCARLVSGPLLNLDIQGCRTKEQIDVVVDAAMRQSDKEQP